jgi:hypothetical protein
VEAHLPAVVSKLAELALAGDVVALRAMLEHGLPRPRPVSVPVTLDMPAGATLSARGDAALDAMAEGRIGVAEGCAILTALAAHGKALEVSELAARMSAIEKAIAEKGVGHA